MPFSRLKKQNIHKNLNKIPMKVLSIEKNPQAISEMKQLPVHCKYLQTLTTLVYLYDVSKIEPEQNIKRCIPTRKTM